jgi:hypothetical protein
MGSRPDVEWSGDRRLSTLLNSFRIGRSGVIRIRLISAIVATLALFVASPDGASAQTGTTTNTQTSGVPPAARPPLAGSSTPSMSRVTGRQDLGLYDPYLGTKVFNSATPPPGNLYGR